MAYNLIDKKYIYEQLRSKNCHPRNNRENYVKEFESVVLEFYKLKPESLTEEAKEILKNESEKFYKKMLDKYKKFGSRYESIIGDKKTVR